MNHPFLLPWLPLLAIAGLSDEEVRAKLGQLGDDFLIEAQQLRNRDGDDPLAHGRVMNMLVGCVRFLEALGALKGPTRRRLIFDTPLTFDGIVTSPLLIACECILRSQSGGGNAETIHDWDEGIAAKGELDDLTDCPSGFSNFVAVVNALKNPVRTSFGDDKELCVFRNGELRTDDESVAFALARFLSPAATMYAGLLEALVLVAAAYDARHSRRATARAAHFMPAYERLRHAVHAVDGSDGSSEILIAVEFMRHALVEPTSRLAQLGKIAEYAQSHKQAATTLVWISLTRYFATNHPDALVSLSIADHLVPQVKEVPDFLSPLFAGGRVMFHRLEVPDAQAFPYVFSAEPPSGEEVWQLISSVLVARADSDLSVGFTLRALEALSHIRPSEFFALDIESNSAPSPMAKSRSIYVPRVAPSDLPGWQQLIDSLRSTSDNPAPPEAWLSASRDPRFLVAQAVAAVLPNRTLMFGAKQRIQKSNDHDAARQRWDATIRQIDQCSPHAPIYDYWNLYSEVCRRYVAVPPMVANARSNRPVVLGVDVGGNETKVALYEYDAQRHRITKRIAILSPSPRTALPGSASGNPQQYKCVRQFADLIATKCALGIPEWNSVQRRIVAIGVTWPGAVAGDAYNEFVAANSLILSYFEPFTPHHWKATASQIVSLGVREAFEAAFTAKDAAPPLVRLSNDGSAHVTASASTFRHGQFGTAEVIAALAVGTGLALKMYDPATQSELQLLSELGRMLMFLGQAPTKGFPGGTARDYLRRDTLGETATEMLTPFANVTAITQTNVPSLLIGWLLAESSGADKAASEREFEEKWRALNLVAGRSSLPQLRRELRAYLHETRSAHAWRGEHDFAVAVARRVSIVLAGIISGVSSIFGTRNFFVSGGPLSGATGVYLRRFAREELRTGFNYTVVEDLESATTHNVARLLRIPEPATSIEALGPSGTYGAALLAVQALAQTGAVHERTPLANVATASPSISAYSLLELGPSCHGRLLFPGVDNLPENCLGYVRSTQRLKLAQAFGKATAALPFRDYPASVLTDTSELLDAPYAEHAVIISARNTVNEWGYTVRRDGVWHRRHADRNRETPPDWPVVVLGHSRVQIDRLRACIDNDADLVTGLPLVVDGRPCSRRFMLRHSSDVAHMYDLDPMGRRGTPPKVWQEFADLWQAGDTEDWSEEEFEFAMNALAGRYGVKESRHLMHSLIAQRPDGSVLIFALTGSLPDIAGELVERWRVQHAVLLDQGGSVGWMALNQGDTAPRLLVAGPNHRPRGTAFILFETGRFLHPAAHPVINAAGIM